MDSTSLSYKTIKNSSYTFIGYIFPIVFSVFITPVVVHRLGVTDYGIYILVNTIMAFLGLLDLGLNVAVLKYVSQYYVEQNMQGINQLLNSANTLYLIIGLIGFSSYILIGKFFLAVFHVGGLSQPHILTVFVLAAVLFFLSSANSVYSIIPGALQRFDIITKLNLVQLTFFNLSMLLAVLLGYKLKVIFLLNILSILGLTLALRRQFKKLLPEIKMRFSWSGQEIAKAYKFGLLVAVNNLASTSLIQLDRFIVPIFVGPAALTYYSLPGNVAQKTGGVVGSLGGVLFPLTSAMVGQKQHEQLRAIYLKVIRNITLVAAACVMSIISFAYPILFYWLGKDFAEKGWLILIIVSVTYFSLSLFNVLQNFLLGLNKAKFLMLTSLALAALNIIFLVLLLPSLGIVGAAWAYLSGVLPVPLIFYWTEKKFLQLNGQAWYYAKLYAKLAVTSAIFFLVMRFAVNPFVNSFATLVIVGPLAVAFYFVLYWLLGFIEKEDEQLFIAYLGAIKARIWPA